MSFWRRRPCVGGNGNVIEFNGIFRVGNRVLVSQFIAVFSMVESEKYSDELQSSAHKVVVKCLRFDSHITASFDELNAVDSNLITRQPCGLVASLRFPG
jgi:hypothetical protein